MLDVLLGLLPKSCANTVLAFLRSMDIAHSEARTVGVETDHVNLARDVDGGFEAIGLCDQEVGGVSPVARALEAETVGVGDAHFDHFVDGGGSAFEPSFAGEASFKLHGGLKNGIPVSGEDGIEGIENIV